MRVVFKVWRANELVEDKVDRCLQQMGDLYAEESDRLLGHPIWDWDKPTLRFQSLLMGGKPGKNGGVWVPEGLRDIVDTGNLMDSRTAPALSAADGKRSMSIAWTAPYAQLIRTGGHFSSYTGPDGNPYYPGRRPGRDWIAKALEDRPPLPRFAELWNSFNITRA